MSTAYVYLILIVPIAFAIVPFRQYGGNFFYFFLILAISGPVSYLIYHAQTTGIVSFNQNTTILLFSHLLIYALVFRNLNKKNRILLFLFFVILSVLIYSLFTYPILFIYFILIHFCVIALILKIAIKHSMDTLEVKLFYVILLLYEMTGIGKYLSLILDLHGGRFFSRLNLAVTIQS